MYKNPFPVTCASRCIYLLGVLAGMWPCGIITLVRELFIAESKSQVYGHLHQFLQDQPYTAHRLSMSQYMYMHNA